jgi:hypothetical protein
VQNTRLPLWEEEQNKLNDCLEILVTSSLSYNTHMHTPLELLYL